MPTTKPRFQVTETPDIEHALQVARIAWPDLRDAERVRRLILEGAQVVEERDLGEREADRRRRRAALAGFAGSLTEAYGPGYLETLREDWPA